MNRTAQWTLDVRDVPRAALFWSAVMGFEIDAGDDGCATLYARGAEPAVTIWLQKVDEPKQGKNRCHPDLVVDGDVDAEVERLIDLGATRADVGQRGDEDFVVLADPEGTNSACCVLTHVSGTEPHARRDHWRHRKRWKP